MVKSVSTCKDCPDYPRLENSVQNLQDFQDWKNMFQNSRTFEEFPGNPGLENVFQNLRTFQNFQDWENPYLNSRIFQEIQDHREPCTVEAVIPNWWFLHRRDPSVCSMTAGLSVLDEWGTMLTPPTFGHGTCQSSPHRKQGRLVFLR